MLVSLEGQILQPASPSTVRQLAVWLVALCVAAATVATHNVAVAQDTTTKVPVAAESRSPKMKKVKPVPVRVVGAYRPVDPGRSTNGTVTQQGLDLYLAVRDNAPVKAGERYAVYRRIRSHFRLAKHVTIKVGELAVLRLENDMAVARVVEGPDSSAQPYIATPGVIVGDFILAGAPLASPKPTVKVVDTKANRGDKPKKKRRKARRRARKKAGEADNDKEPDEPALESDPDAFVHWDERPIDF